MSDILTVEIEHVNCEALEVRMIVFGILRLRCRRAFLGEWRGSSDDQAARGKKSGAGLTPGTELSS